MAPRASSCKTLPAVSRKKDRDTMRAGDKLQAVLGSVPAELERRYTGALVRERFAQAVIDEYGEAAATFILENTQGVYLRKDDAPRKASATGAAPVYLEIYTTEAIIKADLDNRQEALKRRLRKMDVHFDRLKPFSSTGNMRHRAPFEARVAELKAHLAAQEARESGEGAGAGSRAGSGASTSTPAFTSTSPSSPPSPGALAAATPAHLAAALAQVDNPRLADAIRRAMEASLPPAAPRGGV